MSNPLFITDPKRGGAKYEDYSVFTTENSREPGLFSHVFSNRLAALKYVNLFKNPAEFTITEKPVIKEVEDNEYEEI